MALIDVVKYDGNDNEFAWNFPSNDLRLGTQLIVKPAQTAFFVKGGKIYDQFETGTYTLSSGNIPLLNKLLNLPFGGDSPFQSEVWYINLLSKLDNKWGTPNPIQLEDPKYGIVVPVRSYGQFGFKISDPKTFLESLVGTIKIYSAEKIVEYFTGKLLASLSSIITKKIVFDNISILQISAFLEDLSKFCELSIQSEFNKFGIEIVNFFIISINIPENDPSVIKLKEIKEKSMYINTVGKDVYSFDRSMDVMETAAGNEGNIGNLMGAGIGLGMGLGIGGTMGDKMGSIGNQLNTNLNQSNQICSNCNSQNPSASKFCGVCGKELKPNAEPIKSIICDKCGKTSPLGSKFCQHCGDVFFLCLHCGTDNPENVKFCINCGKPMINVCPNCNKELTSSSKFCGNCGHKLF